MPISRVSLILIISCLFGSCAFAQLSLRPGSAGSGHTADDKTNPEATTTRIVLLSNANNSIQLGVLVNGRFAYPFTFTANPGLTSGISISESGVLSGTPSKTDEQNTQIIVTDSNGKVVAKYPIVLHFAGGIP